MRTKSILIIFMSFIWLGLSAQTLETYQKEGEALMNNGDNAGALEKFKKAIELDQSTDENALLYSYAGLCAKYINNDAEAKGFFQTAIDRGFEEPVIFTMLGDICKSQDDVPCQENTYRKAMELFPAEQFSYGVKLSYVYYNSDQWDKLELLTSELLREQPEDEKMLQFYATALQKNRKTNDAKVAYEKVLSINPDNMAANIFLGNYYYQVGKSKLDKEEKNYEAIANPDRVMWSNFQKKTKLIKDEYYTKAVEYLEKAYAQKENPSIKKMLYAAYFKLGDKEKAELYKD